MSDRRLTVPGARPRANLAAFVTRLLRTDDSAVVRVRRRDDDHVEVWGRTGFGVLVVRVLTGTVAPESLVCSATTVLDSLREDPAGDRQHAGGYVDVGFALDSAWRGALPPATGFVTVDEVPARALRDVAARGVEVGREAGGPAGPPASLLDSEVVSVSSGETTVPIALRTAFALEAMGFAADGADEPVRVSASATWVRVDARYGSLYQRRESGPGLLV
ncbi:hypothetical protein [Tsukamurella pseudospumae]|uniref:Uncharacterized protein n=1 Tax=Tsukamurella pseudospumae TaxID=239498 RepID=A0A138AUU6_9ACTN|nr:hypothetical protein [Tsukamurella pseudospumae]KXP00542.1 hypothetical protein AXK61_15240 [Tsukamurella pseudospumae]KXP14220.1 hypothetical protein AXK60_21285 [Tsukamurella pseudospumae]